jgi:hypothetical protein
MSAETITSDPASARTSPSQNASFGRRPNASQVRMPTKIGVLLPSSVAFAAEVARIAVLYSARSSAKKSPPTAIIPSMRRLTRGAARSKNQVGSSTTAGISSR